MSRNAYNKRTVRKPNNHAVRLLNPKEKKRKKSNIFLTFLFNLLLNKKPRKIQKESAMDMNEIRRMSRSSIKARGKVRNKPMDAARKKSAKKSALWRKKNKSKIKAYSKKYRPRRGIAASVDLSYQDALALLREGISPEQVIDAIVTQDISAVLEDACSSSSYSAENVEDALAILFDEDCTEQDIDNIIDSLNEDELDTIYSMIGGDEDELDEMDFNTYFLKIKKGNPNISKEGAQKMYAAMLKFKKKHEDVDERARWKKELDKKYSKLPAGLAKYKIAQLKKKFAGKRDMTLGGQVARNVIKKGAYKKSAKIGGDTSARTMRNSQKRRLADIMNRKSKGGAGGKRMTLKKKLHKQKVKKVRVAVGGVNLAKARQRKKLLANLAKARAARAAKKANA